MYAIEQSAKFQSDFVTANLGAFALRACQSLIELLQDDPGLGKPYTPGGSGSGPFLVYSIPFNEAGRTWRVFITYRVDHAVQRITLQRLGIRET